MQNIFCCSVNFYWLHILHQIFHVFHIHSYSSIFSFEPFINMKIIYFLCLNLSADTFSYIFNKHFWIWYDDNCISFWKVLLNRLLFILRKINNYIFIFVNFTVFLQNSKHTKYRYLFCRLNSN